MKLIALTAFLLITSFSFSCKKNTDINQTSSTDSFTVTVNNGYGGGKFKIGDTVHIFSNAWTVNQVFGVWTGDADLLNAKNEWHSWFLMPPRNVNFTGSVVNMETFNLNYEQIIGRDILKPVYSYFPANHKGIVYLLHGTGGSAANIAGDYEWQQLIKDLVNDKFAIIITEAEESTTGVDANGDGKLRWYLLPADTINNVDYANIRIITDTFYNRLVTNPAKPKYSIGMSNGGFFSSALSYMYNFKAEVQYCAQGPVNIMAISSVPVQFCMARNDDNDQVGPVGNADALSFYNSLNARGICSKYYINERSPLYPERFARSGELTINQGNLIATELKANNYIDSKNYFTQSSDIFKSDLLNNPNHFPIIAQLSLSQKLFILEQISTSLANHHIYSDYNRATLKFLNSQCQ